MSWRYVKAARDHRIWPTLVNWLVTSIKTSEAMQSQTIPKETFIIVIFGGMIRRYDSGYGSGYDSWVWFAELELPTLTKICTPEKKTQPYIYICKIKIYIYAYIHIYIYTRVYLVGGIPNPWKIWLRQLGWWNSQLNGKIKLMFRTTNHTHT